MTFKIQGGNEAKRLKNLMHQSADSESMRRLNTGGNKARGQLNTRENEVKRLKNLMHQPGIEPGSVPWQGTILPLDHWCNYGQFESV